jgi:benzoylformate decarboxylase
MDVLDAPVVEEVRPTSLPSTRSVPDASMIREAAALLAAAQRPMLLVGDGAAYSGAQRQLTRVAELIGAQVWDADSGEVNIDWKHPLYMGMTGHMFGYQSLPTMRNADVTLICGTYALPEVFPELGSIFAEGSRVIHIDLNTYEIAKNHPVDLGMLGDPRETLALLADALDAALTPDQRAAARARTDSLQQAKEASRATALAKDREARDAVPLHMSRFMEELVAHLPEDAILFDEALTNSPAVSRYFPPSRTGQYFMTRGGSLGVGFPGGIGAKLANPDKTVVAFSGDGGSMYTIQALWSAVRHNVATKFVVCNNGSYRLLQANISAYWQERTIPSHAFPLSFDLSTPPIRFDELARGLGVQAVRVEKPWEIASAIEQALAHPGPFLIDLVLEGETRPDLIGVRCGH